MIVLAGTIAYANAFSSPFLFDDHASIVQNATIRAPWRWSAVLVPPQDTPVAGRPLVNLSLALNFALGGLDVTGYRLVNLGLHLACAVTLLSVLRRVLSEDLAFAVTLLWTVHPLNSEVVNYVTQRTESVMALCYLLTMWASGRALDDRRMRWLAAAVAASVAGMASKESMVTAPLMVVFFDRIFVFPSLREAMTRRRALYGGLAASWMMLLILAGSGGQSISAGFTAAVDSPWTYLLNQTVMIVRYLSLAVWPGPLVIYYGWPQPLGLADVWPYALAVIGLVTVTGVLLKTRPRLGFWLGWFFLTLAPTTSVLPIATEVGAERRMYLPLIGIIVVVVTLASQALRRYAPRASPAAGLIALLVVAMIMAARTHARNREYQSPLTMARTVLDRWPTANAEQLVGTELARLDRHAEAVPHLREAVKGYPPARYFLGVSLMKTGDTAGAVTALQTFVREEPDALAAKGAHGMLAGLLMEQQQFEAAIPHYREYLRAQPLDGDAWNGLGVALSRTGRTGDAIKAFQSAITTAPNRIPPRLNLARSLAENGQLSEAAAAVRQALQIAPADPAAAQLLQAIEAARRAPRTDR